MVLRKPHTAPLPHWMSPVGSSELVLVLVLSKGAAPLPPGSALLHRSEHGKGKAEQS